MLGCDVLCGVVLMCFLWPPKTHTPIPQQKGSVVLEDEIFILGVKEARALKSELAPFNAFDL